MSGEAAKVERVGLLVVHGIGPQQRFETAEALTRSLAGTLAGRAAPPRFEVIDRTAARTAAELACPSSDPGDSPFEIVAARVGGGETRIHVHEVWWADLGVSDTLFEQIGFWVWALGQWAARIDRVTHLAPGLSNTVQLMVGPKFAEQPTTEDYAPSHWRGWFRVLLFLWGVAAFLTFFSWNLAKQVMSWISPYIGSSSLITDYVGHVRVYTQGQPVGGGGLEDVGQPWRATIRRRMIAELVAMAERGYDRWYLLAHSQGSVLAFNAVQETEWCLPNYLTLEQADRLRRSALWTRAPFLPPGPPWPQPPSQHPMMPRRPAWLRDDEGVSRRRLFERFRGLVTYGAPLDKFATLWPRIVSLNKQRDVFPEDAAWINLWDATDPIGASLSAFSDAGAASPNGGPLNVHVRANPLFLYSHLCYLKAEAAARRQETSALLDDALPIAGPPPGLRAAFQNLQGGGDAQRWRHWFARLQGALLGIALALGAGLLAYLAKGAAAALIAEAPAPAQAAWAAIGAATASRFGAGYFGAVAFVVALAAAVVGGCGVYRHFRE